MGALKNNSVDVLFIHRGRELPDREDVPLFPLGSFYIADYLDKNGIRVEMLNYPLLRHEERMFNIDMFLREHEVKAVALDLHWHSQSNKVINFARELKQQHPGIKIVLGGNTASFFAREIMEQFDVIDCIIMGDAEVPLLECMYRWQSGKATLSNIPNVVWRQKQNIIFNDNAYICGQSLLENMEYPRFDLLINSVDQYLVQAAIFFIKKSKRMIFYNPGRGCLGACEFCGGGVQAQQLIYKRAGLLWPSLSCVKKTWGGFQKIGIECVYLPFCSPSLEPFFISLFNEFQRKPLHCDVYVETFSIPSQEFMRACRRAFSGEITIVMSPDTGNDKLRKKIKTFSYSNEDLIGVLRTVDKEGGRAKLFFSTGFSNETPQDFLKTIAFVRYIKKRFDVEFDADLIELEPGSPLYLYPEKHGIRPKRSCFIDFMTAASNSKNSAGYDTSYFKDEEIVMNCDRLEQECYGRQD